MLNCSSCKVEKEEAEFAKDPSRNRGYYYWCKTCKSSRSNKQKAKARNVKWLANNKERKRKQNVEYAKRRRQRDLVFRFRHNISVSIRGSFKEFGQVKAESTPKIVGLNSRDFHIHLIESFKSRYGYYPEITADVHIDHVIPLSTAQTIEDIKRLNHYTNLQLLTAIDNLKKSDSVV